MNLPLEDMQFEPNDNCISFSSENLKGILDNKYLIVLLADSATGEILDVSIGASEFYGYSKKRFCKKNINDISVLKCKEQIQKQEKQVNDNSPVKYYDRHCLSNGDIRDVEILEGPVFIKNKIIICAIVYDITEKLKEDRATHKVADRYMELVELSPVGIAVISDGIIKYVNIKAMEIYGCKNLDMIVGKKFVETVIPSMKGTAANYIASAGTSDKQLPSCELKIIRNNNSIIECEFDSSQLIFDNKASIQLVFRDITENKKDIKRASGVQKHRLAVKFPLSKFGKLETIYMPANDVSGDFYQLYKINDSKIIGIIGDVAGKGITAALDTTALKVMFYDGVAVTHDPVRLLRFLNMEVARHMENEYVAACCFTFDFKQCRLNIAGAGINQFIFSRVGNPMKQITMIGGTYLGMFEESRFQNKEIYFEPGDRFYFYTDGFDLLLENEQVYEKCAIMPSIGQLKSYLSDMLSINKVRRDDCTMMIVEII